MQYNFDKFIDRSGSDCKKFRHSKELNFLPLWIADTDFEVPDFVSKAMIERANHKCYGYPYEDEEFGKVTANWIEKRHGHSIQDEDVVFVTGVIPGLTYIIDEFTNPGDHIVYNTPIYNPIMEAIEDGGRVRVESPFIKIENEYRIDFEDLEEKLKNPKASLFVLVNPHNPLGKVYCKEELLKILELCLKYNVKVFSDEIHSDIILTKDKKHIPFASLNKEASDICFTGYNPGKAFNVSGLRTACIVIQNKNLRERFIIARKKFKGMGLTIFGQAGYIACYKYGYEYVDELVKYIEKNYEFVKSFFKDNNLKITTSNLEGTYLMWLDFSEYFNTQEELDDFIKHKAHIYLNKGTSFGENGKLHMRMNIATTKSYLKEALERLKDALNELY